MEEKGDFIAVFRAYMWSAVPVQINKCPPVLRFYASLRHTSSLQGNAATGAKWPVQFFISEVAGCAKICA
ncbi:hypothetical protein CA265_11015 [Sphingobacteriaceae bacterium GW460-11-11-14-LB5]|nr:hypothetical protein CA265_11015 [Sphingobacteriaceae bacterium GW460-11-11-14-LB5]